MLFGNALEMAVAGLIQAMIGEERGLDDLVMLPDSDHCQILDTQIRAHRHQVGILLAFNNFFRLDLSGLSEMQFCRSLAQH